VEKDEKKKAVMKARISDAEVFCLKAVATWHRYQSDRFIVLPLEAGCGKVHGADAQQSPVDLVALGVHWALGLAFGPCLDAKVAAVEAS
jgi:hypothetical protein